MNGLEIISPEWKPLTTLLDVILERLEREIPDVVGVTITAQHPDRAGGKPVILVSSGVDAVLTTAQLDRDSGPVLDAIEHDLPIRCDDLWTDTRWPELTREALLVTAPDSRAVWQQLAGYAAVPGPWNGSGTIVLSCGLRGPATEAVLETVTNHERWAAAAVAVAAASTDEGAERALSVLRSRAAIDQAKGAVMGLLRCDAQHAWSTLRRASQQFNVKLRELAVALVEYLGDAPAEQPTVDHVIHPGEHARRAAELTWQALSLPQPDRLLGETAD
jgi:hypothetical protein